MKILNIITGTAVLSSILAGPICATAADQQHAGHATNAKVAAKPYPLKTCIVSDEKLGEMGKPYVFVHEGQEIKLCCKDCLKDFNKEPAKYIKKLAEAQKSGKGAKAGAPAHDHSAHQH
jgi:hypothetical protein